MQLGRVGFAHGTQFAAVVYDDGVNSANSVVPLIRNEYSHYVKYDAICDPELYVGYYKASYHHKRTEPRPRVTCAHEQMGSADPPAKMDEKLKSENMQ